MMQLTGPASRTGGRQKRLVPADTATSPCEQALQVLQDALSTAPAGPDPFDPNYVDGFFDGLTHAMGVLQRFADRAR